MQHWSPDAGASIEFEQEGVEQLAIPTESELTVLHPLFAARYALRCAQRVRPLLAAAPAEVQPELREILPTFDAIESAEDKELSAALIVIVKLSAGRKTWNWNGIRAVATLSSALYAALAFRALMGNATSDWGAKLSKAAFKAGANALSSIEAAVEDPAAVRMLEARLRSDYEILAVLPADDAQVRQISARLDELLGALWGGEGSPIDGST